MHPKPQILRLIAPVTLKTKLIDVRLRTAGIVFGNIKQICNQYGIKYVERKGFMEFYAPKSRLQMLLEKLHFSGIPYSI